MQTNHEGFVEHRLFHFLEAGDNEQLSMSGSDRHQGVINFREEIQWSSRVAMSWQIILDQTMKCSELFFQHLKHFSCEMLEF